MIELIAIVINIVVLIYVLSVIPKKLKTILANQKIILKEVQKLK